MSVLQHRRCNCQSFPPTRYGVQHGPDLGGLRGKVGAVLLKSGHLVGGRARAAAYRHRVLALAHHPDHLLSSTHTLQVSAK